jgi:hypothetical protein
MRHVVWYVVFSLAIGALLAAVLPFLLPWYGAIAVIGGLMLLAHLAHGQGPAGRTRPQSRPSDWLTPSVIDEYLKSRAAEHEAAEARTAQAYSEPWFADAVVDMDALAERLKRTEGPSVSPGIMVPNPYFVLPLDKLPAWNFATPVEVREAVKWANSPTPPIRWQNPGLRRLLNQMGWPTAEAYARIGLFFWHTDDGKPDPRSAAIEADMRRQNLVYDVPRPASLG